MSKIFLTGGGGFIGKHLTKRLIELGYDVFSDMRKLHTQKYDALIHLASNNNIKNEFDPALIESNIILTKEIFKVPTRIIYASSCVAKYPMNPYAYSKLYAEHLGAIHGNSVGLRLHNVYGTNNNKGIVWWLMQQENGAHITIRGEQQVRDFIYVDDIINHILEVIDIRAYCGVHEVGTGIGTQIMDLVNLYMKLSGKEFFIDVEPAADYEPPVMVSDRIVSHISLEEGLKKTIQ